MDALDGTRTHATCHSDSDFVQHRYLTLTEVFSKIRI